MQKNKPLSDRRPAWGPAIYPTRHAARLEHQATASHAAVWRADAPLPLSRIFHPYEYWTHATPDCSGDDAWAPSRREPDPPKSGWPAAPPAAFARWLLHRWTVRGRFRFGAV